MLPNSIRVMNTKDLVPRHPFITGFLGVGTKYFIDEEGGGTPSESIGCSNIILGALTSVSYHMWDAYLKSFQTAAVWFNAKYPAEEMSLTTQDRVLSAINRLEYPEYSYRKWA